MSATSRHENQTRTYTKIVKWNNKCWFKRNQLFVSSVSDLQEWIRSASTGRAVLQDHPAQLRAAASGCPRGPASDPSTRRRGILTLICICFIKFVNVLLHSFVFEKSMFCSKNLLVIIEDLLLIVDLKSKQLEMFLITLSILTQN